MTDRSHQTGLQKPATGASVTAFLDQVAQLPAKGGGDRLRGRLLFAMDATKSREPTWDMACSLQADMFTETADLGGLDVSLAFYRGFGECKAGPWVSDPRALLGLMGKVRCAAGRTQIGRILDHAQSETRKMRVNALVFVGDRMEEDADLLAEQAGQLGLLGLPVFPFLEGADAQAERSFRDIAKLSGGVFCRFDVGAAAKLRSLLGAVAVYAAGGRKALEHYGAKAGGEGARLLLPALSKR
ncbi:VWA domain-containing protein [Rhodospirillum sp. A1_3_36]|uniref:VWA domain-containing protein n=1 Tax=Rhodospirillum sp. A1_3_36 TaxID=3391666 RepID=UPI0039A48A1E